MSTLKVDTVRPVTTDGSLTLQGDSSGSGVTGITIDSSGNTALNGNLVIPDSGTIGSASAASALTIPASGIPDFPNGLTFASNATGGNITGVTLDDYEEGTWAPTVTSGSGAITAYTATGRYTKIGRVVIARSEIDITTIGTAGGSYSVSNLPFTALSTVKFSGYGRERVNTGFGLSIDYASTTSFLFQKYDGTFFGANGHFFILTVIYEV